MVAVADYMTVSEAARELGVTERAIHKRITSGHMHAERFGERAVLIPVEEVNRWRDIGRLKTGPKRQDETATEEQARENREHLELLDQERRRIRGEEPTP